MRRLTVCVLALLVAASAWGASVSGYIETSYSMNLNDPPEPVWNPLHLYDAKANSFLINCAHVAFTGGFDEDVDYRLELEFGSDALLNSPILPIGFDFFNVQEAYIHAKSPDSGFGLKAGKFAGYAGLELMESPENPTFTRGFIYTYGVPATHTGALVTYEEGQVGLAFGFVNGWDLVMDDDDDPSTLLSCTLSPEDNFDLTITYVKGPENYPAGGPNWYDRTLLSVVGSMEAAPGTTVLFEYNSGTQEAAGPDDEWSGFGLQMVVAGSDDFSLGIRYETFDDTDNARGVGDEVSNMTISPAFKLSSSTTLRFDLRFDTAANGTPFDDDQGNPTDKQTTLGMEVFSRF